MQAVILAGGLGTRLSEVTDLIPKPMVPIGSKPMLWHIMKIFSAHGINDFIICCGYKGYVIKEYFSNYALHMSDVTFNMRTNAMQVHNNQAEPWQVTLVNTGENTLTAGRLKKVQHYLHPNEDFCFTYGDGLGNVNISQLINYHKSHGRLSTVTAVRPPGRFGTLALSENNVVEEFYEKPAGDGGWINGGFFVLSPKALETISEKNETWEQGPLQTLTRDKELMAYQHHGFWHPMDTLRDKNWLNDCWAQGNAPWKVW